MPDISHTEIDPPSEPNDSFPHAPQGVPGAANGGDALDDPRVLAVVQEYMSELDTGRAPDRSNYLNRYPELAGAIRQCLDGLELVKAVGPRSSSGARSIMPDPAPKALGDFQIIRELGRGGMGVVYEAMQLSLSRRVALKVLPFAATFDARQLQRFKNEAQAAALLHHTNIVPIYAVGCERGVHFYAMQLIEGHSLALLIGQLREQAGLSPNEHSDSEKSGSSISQSVEVAATDTYLAGPKPGGTVPLAMHSGDQLRSTAGASLTITARSQRGGDNYFHRVVRLMIQAADALEHAHQLGIVHRDIKPANLLVNTTGTLWVADFGLAQFQADASLTRTGDLVGTFRYMSPEQAGGQRTAIDHRTDIYSLGATFYELLTLAPVFRGETRQELLYQILNGEPKAPRLINRTVPIELDTIVLKALRKAPAERYGSAGELADDLRRFLDHRPILARRPTAVDRARKWSRRHPSVVVAGVLLLAVCLVALLVSNRLIAREQEKTADALDREKESNRLLAVEQQKTTAALDREKERANETEELFRQARQAVDVLVEVSEEELADNFPMVHTRKRLLQTAIGFYQDFIEQRRGDAASQADLAAVEQRVKGILHELELVRRDMQTILLGKAVVVDELRLNDEQRERIANLVRQREEDGKSLRRDLEGLDEEDRRHRLIALAEKREGQLAQILTAEQAHRLGQLALQAQGLFAFKEPDVDSALSLTTDQRLAIRKIEREMFFRLSHHDDGRGPPDKPGRGPDHGPKKRGPQGSARDDQSKTDDFKQAIAKVLGLLNDEQIKRWRELTGMPVESLMEPPFGGPKKPHGDRPREDRPKNDRPPESGPHEDEAPSTTAEEKQAA